MFILWYVIFVPTLKVVYPDFGGCMFLLGFRKVFS